MQQQLLFPQNHAQSFRVAWPLVRSAFWHYSLQFRTCSHSFPGARSMEQELAEAGEERLVGVYTSTFFKACAAALEKPHGSTRQPRSSRLSTSVRCAPPGRHCSSAGCGPSPVQQWPTRRRHLPLLLSFSQQEGAVTEYCFLAVPVGRKNNP